MHPAGSRPRGNAGRRPSEDAAAPDPRRLVGAVARIFLEVEAGRRPFRQLAPLLAPALLVRLEGTVPAPGPLPAPVPHPIVAVRYDEPAPGIVDAVVVVRGRPRVTSLVIRIERHRGSWRVVELGRPETRTRTVHRPDWVAARDLPPPPDTDDGYILDEVGLDEVERALPDTSDLADQRPIGPLG
jgi:hypothetical protein